MTTVTNLPPEATLPTGRTIPIPQDAARQDRPDMPRPALDRMRTSWELPDLLLGCTDAMHEAGTRVLVREERESDAAFRRRMSRTILTNYYGDTLDRHSALPFAKTIKFDPPLPERLAYLERNADGCGRSITVLARDMLREGMHRGMTHLLVDLRVNAGTDLAAELTRRPLLLHITPDALYGVAEQSAQDGQDHVKYARFRQSTKERFGQFGERSAEHVMVIETDGRARGESWTWSKNQDGTWIASAPIPYTRGSVPLFTFFAKQTGEYEAEPAYRYLAELNLAHFQSDADQRHGLSYGRRSTLVKTGWKEALNPAEAAAKGQKIAPDTTLGFGRQIVSRDESAKAYFLETSGGGLQAGFADLAGLESRMERFGAAQVSKSGGITATSRQLDNQRDTCNLEAWCTRLELVLMGALRAAAQWIKVDLPAGQKVLIDRSFADDTPDSEDVPTIVDLGKSGLLSTATVLAELKARGTLVTVEDPDAEAQRIQDQSGAAVEADMQKRAAEMLAARGAPDPNAQPDGGGQTP